MSGGAFPYRLRSCVWEITLACCFSCAYCGSCGGKGRENELTTEECDDVARQLKELGCRRVSLIGGEVFMRPDWKEIVRSLTSKNVRVCIITNGYTMTDPILNALKELNVESVAVSLDGPREAHDAFRQKGSFDRALSAISRLTESGIPTSVISALRADNYRLLPELLGILKNYPIFAWQLQACSPMGNAKKNGVDVAFDASFVLDFVAQNSKKVPFMLGVADNIGYFTKDEGSLRGVTDGSVAFSGCGAGLTSIGIDSVGNVRGCESMYDEFFIEGNLRRRSLRDIWEDENAFSYNRRFTADDLTGACAVCPYGAICAGGCRSYNYFTNGGTLYETVLCAKRHKK